jgi:hypothetical protein
MSNYELRSFEGLGELSRVDRAGEVDAVRDTSGFDGRGNFAPIVGRHGPDAKPVGFGNEPSCKGLYEGIEISCAEISRTVYNGLFARGLKRSSHVWDWVYGQGVVPLSKCSRSKARKSEDGSCPH